MPEYPVTLTPPLQKKNHHEETTSDLQITVYTLQSSLLSQHKLEDALHEAEMKCRKTEREKEELDEQICRVASMMRDEDELKSALDEAVLVKMYQYGT
ncbi:hypothetical protein BDN70DRAFT_940033 [Pholiota conissans]|uniref:Uncharacterized protein n=1 Tax=Pholiota conissans TaxID=109636 RepID=A0A9P5YK86_9AGAR|nr:hypothetical protein BDN70DRAFT_940033 [Pholiota conissans]